MSPGRGRAVTAALLLATAAAFAAPKKPTNAALRKAFENNAHAVVEVAGPRKSGAGVIVGASGQVLTSVDFVSLEEATVKVGGQSFHAKVVMANADLKAALVVADLPPAPKGAADAGSPPAAFRPPAVKLDEPFVAGTELVAIVRDEAGALRPRLVEVSQGRKVTSPFVDVSAPLPNGTPLFDGQGRLVAIAVQRRKASSRALPVPEVKGQLAQAAAP